MVPPSPEEEKNHCWVVRKVEHSHPLATFFDGIALTCSCRKAFIHAVLKVMCQIDLIYSILKCFVDVHAQCVRTCIEY